MTRSASVGFDHGSRCSCGKHPIRDDDGAKLVLNAVGSPFQRLKVIFADSVYGKTGLPDGARQCFGWILQTVLRPIGGKGFVVLPKRWIVERMFAWISKYRRHSKDDERNPQSGKAMIPIAMTAGMLKYLQHRKGYF
ncbi:MAG: hypothetical protein LBQ54_15455 [Planctomycetaceae bacterium]|jgi:putative transposase|nr:hypothetical protein [Planctomycetaceae bacterium]